MAAFALTASLALLTPLLRRVPARSGWCCGCCGSRGAAARRCPRIGALALVGLALLPLISRRAATARSGSALGAVERLQAIPQYYLTGYSGAPLGHGVELLVALPILAGLGSAWRMWRRARPPRGARARCGSRWRSPPPAGS
jgi:hypothetical protein